MHESSVPKWFPDKAESVVIRPQENGLTMGRPESPMTDGGGGTGKISKAADDANILHKLSPIPSLILSPSCRITQASDRFLQLWKVSADACIGQDLSGFLEPHVRPGHRNDIVALECLIDSAIAVREERTTAAIHAGLYSTWTARVIPIFQKDELLAIYLEWKEYPAPNALLHGQIVKTGLGIDEAFRILVQAVKDYAIFLLDTKGNIVTWNTGAELHKGYTRDEIIGKHFSVFYGKEDLAINKPQMELEICLREGRVEDEGWRYRKDGSRFWANVIITAVYKDGVHVGFGKVTRDLTERKAAESRLISVYEESEKLKSEFLANMSHEIRTPMHGMLSACSLLLDTPLTEKQRDIASIMDESGKVLLQVINDILDYSKLASGTFSINTDIVGVTSIITSVVRSVQATLQPTVYFELFLGHDLPRSAQGDPLRFRQIVQNIVGNAAKFTEKGWIRVRASLQAEDEDSYTVMTEVTDTGIGISEESSRGLFTPFTQFDLTTTKRYKGTGLGLSIAKSLTELMGGQIGYRPSQERQGSIFWFTVRLKKIKSLDQVQNWDRRNAQEAAPPAQKMKKLKEVAPLKTLLLVEDNTINQKVMVGMLRALGFKNTELASNGAEAVAIVRSKPAAYDLVLMDISMPILDGNQASMQIRDSGILVPIVAMTAYALKGDKERCLEHGMDDYISKPVDRTKLTSILYKWLVEEKEYRKYEAPLKALTEIEATLGRRGSRSSNFSIEKSSELGDSTMRATDTDTNGNSTADGGLSKTSEVDLQDGTKSIGPSNDACSDRHEVTSTDHAEPTTTEDGAKAEDGSATGTIKNALESVKNVITGQ